jgi:hypothetical protein
MLYTIVTESAYVCLTLAQTSYKVYTTPFHPRDSQCLSVRFAVNKAFLIKLRNGPGGRRMRVSIVALLNQSCELLLHSIASSLANAVALQNHNTSTSQ